MKKSLIIGGFLVIIISAIGLFRTFQEREVLLNGKEIDVTVISVSKGGGKWTKSFFVFEYNGKRYSKDMGGKLERVKNSRSIKLKTNSDNSVFVYPDENINKEFIPVGFLFVMGITIVYKGIKYK